MHTGVAAQSGAKGTRSREWASGAGEGRHETTNTRITKTKALLSLSLASARPDRTHTNKENCPRLLRWCWWCFLADSQSRGGREGRRGMYGAREESSDGHETTNLTVHVRETVTVEGQRAPRPRQRDGEIREEWGRLFTDSSEHRRCRGRG